LNNSKYYVIRGIFKKRSINTSFLNYIDEGSKIINKYNFKQLEIYPKIYLYGCGQFLFKILNQIQQYTNIINIVDDNTCYKGKNIDNINIIDSITLFKQILPNDIIIITTLVHSDKIKENLEPIKKNLTILNISEL
jgi:FlaA1/EpsC-like NDP-sugar epimerase